MTYIYDFMSYINELMSCINEIGKSGACNLDKECMFKLHTYMNAEDRV
jgi:hypothetical protein